jgi:DNA-binding transcriptional MocR family regulator
MSKLALGAFYRLAVQPRMDGTAMYILFYLSLRHDEKEDAAWPSVSRIMRDLDLTHGTVFAALKRLESAKLIRRIRGGGRSRTTRYQLPWLGSHRLNPKSDNPIDWPWQKQSSTPNPLNVSSRLDGSDPETVQAGKQYSPVGGTESVQSAGHENSKTNKNALDEEKKDWKTARDACLDALNLSR